jgi:hypothetical protein
MSVAQQCDTTWQPLQSSSGPVARDLCGLVFDTRQSLVVLYGGRAVNGTPLNDTWVWNGDSWSRVDNGTGPTSRQSFAIAYDDARDQTLVFGGFNPASNVANSQLWAWGVGGWQLLSSGGPAPRQGAVMAYDSVRNVTMMFGGFASGYRRDLWEWDGMTWIFRGEAGPAGRDDASMAFDPQRNKLVLFGGFTAAGIAADTWEWSFNPQLGVGTWVQRTGLTTQPASRYGGAMTWDAQSQRVALFGGSGTGTQFFSDSWTFGADGWTQERTTTPLSRQTAMAYDPTRQTRVMFGGNIGGGNRLDDTWERKDGLWRPKSGTRSPVARTDAVFVFDPVRESTVLAGGQSDAGILGDTWLLHRGVWGQLSTVFPARMGAASTFDGSRNRVVTFGGRTPTSDAVAETLEFGNDAWLVRPIGTPPARRFAQMVFDSNRGVSVMYGGLNSTGAILSETWELGPSGWVQIPVLGPTPIREAFAMVYDPQRSRIVLHGGSAGTTVLSDTWVFENSTWTPRSTNGPALDSAAMAFDPTRGVNVLVGGSPDYDPTIDAWELGDSNWEQVQPVASPVPVPRLRPQLAFDLAHGQSIMFGGTRNPGLVADGWRYIGPGHVYVTDHVDPFRSSDGQVDVTFSVTGRGFAPVQHQWYLNGQPLVETPGRFVGTNAPTLQVFGATRTDEGEYACRIFNDCSQAWSSARLVFFCDDLDFNNNDIFPEDQDVIDFLSVLAGAECAPCSDLDFNNNGIFPEDQDIVDFFNVLAGGDC